MTAITIPTEFKTAAEAGCDLLERAFNAAIGLPEWAMDRVVENWDLGNDCYARDDYVGAWMAYGTGYLAITDNELCSLLKRDEHGQII